jgi:hypothetical protein
MQNLGRRILSLFLALTGSAIAASAPAASIEVQLHDFAALDAKTLRKFGSFTQDILNGTGLAIQVRICRGNLAVPCESQTGNTSQRYLKFSDHPNRASLRVGYPRIVVTRAVSLSMYTNASPSIW